MTVESPSKDAVAKRANASFRKEERAKDAKVGAAVYEAASRAVAAKTVRLRALRLAKEAADLAKEAADREAEAANPVKPAMRKRAVRSTS